VFCVDHDVEKLKVLEAGQVPFYEPGLSERMQRALEMKRLMFGASLEAALVHGDVLFIAVGTPPDATGRADLTAVFTVVDQIIASYQAQQLTGSKVLVTKSTVSVGTGAKIKQKITEAGLASQIKVVSNPEFLREGSAVHDFFHPDRIVLGGSDEAAMGLVKKLYDPLYRNEAPVVLTTLETSELSKYASNTFLDNSEVSNVVNTTGASLRYNGSYNFFTNPIAASSEPPNTIRSG
jgi:UDPglucose 6-dehydrogenase